MQSPSALNIDNSASTLEISFVPSNDTSITVGASNVSCYAYSENPPPHKRLSKSDARFSTSTEPE